MISNNPLNCPFAFMPLSLKISIECKSVRASLMVERVTEFKPLFHTGVSISTVLRSFIVSDAFLLHFLLLSQTGKKLEKYVWGKQSLKRKERRLWGWKWE